MTELLYKASKYNMVIKRNNEFIYVYNTKTGSLCKFDKQTFSVLSTLNGCKKQHIPYFDSLLSQGFIVQDKVNEFNKIIFNYNMAVFNQSPRKLSFVIAPTLNCNLRCKYCFENNSKKDDGFNDQVMDDCFNFIKSEIEKYKSVEMLTIDWFGGEPLLKINEIINFSKRIINFCKEKNIKYKACMLTNGVLLTPKIAKVLKSECGVQSVQIPMDGTQLFYCELKQTTQKIYEQVLKNIVQCCDILSIQVRLNTNRQNYHDIKALSKYLLVDLKLLNKIRIYLAELRYFEDYTTDIPKDSCLESFDFVKTKLDFLNYIKNDLGLKDFKIGYNVPKVVSCGLCINTNCVIGPNGELYRCEHHVGRPECIIGNCNVGKYYTDNDLKFIMLSYSKKCKSCIMFPTCFCGCKSAYFMKGINNDFCKSMKFELKNLLEQKIEDIENKKDTFFNNVRNIL